MKITGQEVKVKMSLLSDKISTNEEQRIEKRKSKQHPPKGQTFFFDSVGLFQLSFKIFDVSLQLSFGGRNGLTRFSLVLQFFFHLA